MRQSKFRHATERLVAKTCRNLRSIERGSYALIDEIEQYMGEIIALNDDEWNLIKERRWG